MAFVMLLNWIFWHLMERDSAVVRHLRLICLEVKQTQILVNIWKKVILTQDCLAMFYKAISELTQWRTALKELIQCHQRCLFFQEDLSVML